MHKILLFGLALLVLFPKMEGVEKVEKVVILGSGPAGLSAAIFAGAEHLSPLVIDKKEVGSLIFEKEYLIENYPGFDKGIDSQTLYHNMRRQAADFGARFMDGLATGVDLSKRPFHVFVDGDKYVLCETLIIATGRTSLKIPGQERLRGKWVTGFENVVKSDYTNKNTIILGGGDTALVMALKIAPEAKSVTIVNLDKKPTAAKYLLKRAEGYPHLRFISDTTIREFHLGADGKLSRVELFNPTTKKTSSLSAEEVIVAIGQAPNSELFKEKLKMDSQGYIQINPRTTMTTIKGVFAAGDVADTKFRKLITSAGTGAMAGMEAEAFLDEESAVLAAISAVRSPEEEP